MAPIPVSCDEGQFTQGIEQARQVLRAQKVVAISVIDTVPQTMGRQEGRNQRCLQGVCGTAVWGGRGAGVSRAGGARPSAHVGGE